MRTLMKFIGLFALILTVANCASSKNMPRVTLVLPPGFRGEIFIAEDENKGQDWKSGQILVPVSGIAFVSSLKDLAKTTPENFTAHYSDGGKLGNSVLKTGEETSLWPVEYVDNELLYFVVGTFHEKTVHENEKMNTGWVSVIASIKAKRADAK